MGMKMHERQISILPGQYMCTGISWAGVVVLAVNTMCRVEVLTQWARQHGKAQQLTPFQSLSFGNYRLRDYTANSAVSNQ
jgi:hypothetical protein